MVAMTLSVSDIHVLMVAMTLSVLLNHAILMVAMTLSVFPPKSFLTLWLGPSHFLPFLPENRCHHCCVWAVCGKGEVRRGSDRVGWLYFRQRLNIQWGRPGGSPPYMQK